MKPPRSLVVLVAAGKLYSRPLRHRIGSHRIPSAAIRLGPVMSAEHRVALRSPRLSDASAWQTLRLRDQHLIEPFWVSSSKSWSRRHTEGAWIDELLHMRKEARAGRALPLVIEVEGRFAGQFNVEHIDCGAQSAEVGVWIDSTLAGQGIALAAANLLAQYVFDILGLRRVTAPVCVDNRPATRLVRQVGMQREGTMASYLDVGGRRKDHDLWAITSTMWAAKSARDSNSTAS